MKLNVGIIGCGNISEIYLRNCIGFDNIAVTACADLNIERAKARAAQFNIPHAYTVDELLADPDIELVINLTIPAAHAEVSMKALEAGKHVYVEKPLAATVEEGRRVLELAKQKGLLVGSAPETFMGGGQQTCLQLVEEGAIGKPFAAAAFMMARGHEFWHPDPEFYYQKGGGPLFDMGPYYMTSLINLLGPIARVSGSSIAALTERVITSEPKRGKVVPVETPTHITGVLEFASGAVATIIMSFDIFGGSTLPSIELYGTEGTLRVPDPNHFGGPVLLRKMGEREWQEIALTHGHTHNDRGIGVKDMAYAIRNGRHTRVNGELAYHVLEAMQGLQDASANGAYYTLQSTCRKPEAVPVEGIIE